MHGRKSIIDVLPKRLKEIHVILLCIPNPSTYYIIMYFKLAPYNFLWFRHLATFLY